MILQTLQQLKDVYGDSVDKIIQGNTSNIVFLKSTDDSLLETLEKMSGKTHVSRTNSKTVTKYLEKLVMQNEGKISLTTSTSEEPVISYNDMAFISERNSIVFRAGDSPIWNRNETILPMAWRLHMHNIKQPGHDYTFSTLPTLSTAKDFDVRNNQPNFDEMLRKRLAQAMVAKDVEESYQEAYGYTDDEIQRLDPDDYADEVMQMINVSVNGYQNASDDPNSPDNPENLQYLMGQDDEYDTDDPDDDLSGDTNSDAMQDAKDITDKAEINTEQIQATKNAAEEVADLQEAKFAGNTIRPLDLVDKGGAINGHGFDQAFVMIYRNNLGDFRSDSEHFKVGDDGSLYSADGSQVYIKAGKKSTLNKEVDELSKAKDDATKRVYENNKDTIRDLPRDYTVDDNFYRYLAGLDSWKKLANGRIEKEMVRENRSVSA